MALNPFGRQPRREPQPKKYYYYKCFDCNYPVFNTLGFGCPKCKSTKFISITETEYDALEKGLQNG